MELTLGKLMRLTKDLGRVYYDEGQDVAGMVDNIPIEFARYNTVQCIDRIVLQVRGGYKVMIHTADSKVIP